MTDSIMTEEGWLTTPQGVAFAKFKETVIEANPPGWNEDLAKGFFAGWEAHQEEIQKRQDDEIIDRIRINLPMLAGTQEAAAAILSQLDVPHDLSGETVFVMARNLSRWTWVFTAEFMRLLALRTPQKILLIGSPDQFIDDMFAAAEFYKYENIYKGTADDLIV